MTQPYPIPRSYREAGPYDFDGTSTVYGPFGAPTQFSIFDPVDVVVERRTSSTAAWVEEEVTIAKTSSDPLSAFTIEFSEAYPNTHDFRFYGRRLHERSLDVTKGVSISADKLELELSKMAVVLDELRRDVDTPMTTVQEAVNDAQAAAVDAETARALAVAAAEAAAASAEAAAEWDPSSYSTTAQIEIMLGNYTPKTRQIAAGTGLKINGGASANLSATITVTLDLSAVSLDTADWTDGTSETVAPISPSDLKAAIDAHASSSAWDVVVEDRKTQGTQGGALSAGWNTRTLNTLKVNHIGATLSSNVVTLPKGTYQVEADAPGYSCDNHKVRLFNTTTASVVDYGTAEMMNTGSQTRSVVTAEVTSTTTFGLRLDHYVITGGTNTAGLAVTSGTEIYARMKIKKIA